MNSFYRKERRIFHASDERDESNWIREQIPPRNTCISWALCHALLPYANQDLAGW